MDEPKKVRVKEGWLDAGKEGEMFGVHLINGRRWAVVQWPDDDDPDLHKVEGLEVASQTWETIK